MACCETFIITPAQVRTTCGFDKYPADQKLAPFLRSAQAALEKILGRTMYDELDQAIIADPTLVASPKYKALIPYVRDLLAWRTLEFALPRITASPTANGLHTVNSPEFQSVDSRGLSMQVSQARSAADTAQDRMVDFIKENLSTYDKFGTSVGSEERITKSYPGGVITRRSKYQDPLFLRTSVNRNRYSD